jgi:predicted Zn-dependent peptidase
MVTYRNYKLNNGLKVLFSDIPHRKDLGIYVICRIGSNYERKNLNGMSHFLEHMCFKGTTNRTKFEIINDFAKIGANYNAATSDDSTCYYAVSHHKYWNSLLDIVLDIYLNSTFPEDEIKIEKKVIFEEMSMYNNDEGHIINTAVIDELYGNQPAGRPILGLKKNIRKFTRKHLIKFKEDFYSPNNTIIMVIGNIGKNKKNIMGQIREKVSHLKRGSANICPVIKDTQRGIKTKMITRYTPQTVLHFVFRAGKALNPDTYKYELLACIIGGTTSSRLYRLLREERGISYYTTANLQYSCSHGFFTIETGIENDKIIDTLSIITEIIKDLKQNLVTETELKFAKKLLNTQEELMLDTQNDYASYLQRYLVYGKKIEKLGVRREKRNKITRQQIRNLCKKLFVNNNFLLVGLGPLKNSKKLKTAISLTI